MNASALQAAGYPSILNSQNYPQLSRLLALRVILKNYVTALQAAGSPGQTQENMSQLSRLLALRARLKKL